MSINPYFSWKRHVIRLMRDEVEAYLLEDAAKLRAYVFGATEKQPLKLEKA